jgi:hypothetical protein
MDTPQQFFCSCYVVPHLPSLAGEQNHLVLGRHLRRSNRISAMERYGPRPVHDPRSSRIGFYPRTMAGWDTPRPPSSLLRSRQLRTGAHVRTTVARISYDAALATITYAALTKESRRKSIKATGLHRRSERTAGPSTTLLRSSGRDDNSCVRNSLSGKHLAPAKELSSRPELRRSVVEGPAVLSPSSHAETFSLKISITEQNRVFPQPLQFGGRVFKPEETFQRGLFVPASPNPGLFRSLWSPGGRALRP